MLFQVGDIRHVTDEGGHPQTGSDQFQRFDQQFFRRALMNPDRNGVSTLDGWKKGFLTKCTTCHTAIHGTDLPSQSISGQGAALTR